MANVIGSNIANVFLILGLAAIIMPLASWRRTAMRDALVAAFVALALYGLVRGEMIGRTEGAVLMVVLVGYLFATYWLERRETGHTTFDEEASDFEDIAIRRNWIPLVLVAVGVGALVLGPDLLVTGSVTIARDLGVSDAAIGLSLVALGTSLPELATAIVASCRRHADVVLGNIIGSNIFNILAILGLTVLIQPTSRRSVCEHRRARYAGRERRPPSAPFLHYGELIGLLELRCSPPMLAMLY